MIYLKDIGTVNRFDLLGITVSNVIPMNELHEQLSIYNFEKHAKEAKMDRTCFRA